MITSSAGKRAARPPSPAPGRRRRCRPRRRIPRCAVQRAGPAAARRPPRARASSSLVQCLILLLSAGAHDLQLRLSAVPRCRSRRAARGPTASRWRRPGSGSGRRRGPPSLRPSSIFSLRLVALEDEQADDQAEREAARDRERRAGAPDDCDQRDRSQQAPTIRVNRKASASDLSGLIIASPSCSLSVPTGCRS